MTLWTVQHLDHKRTCRIVFGNCNHGMEVSAEHKGLLIEMVKKHNEDFKATAPQLGGRVSLTEDTVQVRAGVNGGSNPPCGTLSADEML